MTHQYDVRSRLPRSLVLEASHLLDVRPPAFDEDEQRWVEEKFTKTEAMTLFLAGCAVHRKGEVSDAKHLVEDACRAQFEEVRTRFDGRPFDRALRD